MSPTAVITGSSATAVAGETDDADVTVISNMALPISTIRRVRDDMALLREGGRRESETCRPPACRCHGLVGTQIPAPIAEVTGRSTEAPVGDGTHPRPPLGLRH